jgi:ABC-type transport system involved in multi-copper enzyme maturation permease subunit
VRRILTVALAAYRETVRRRVFFISVGFALLIFFVPLAAIPLASGQKETLVRDIGLSFIDIFAVVLALLMSTSLVYDEIERRTVYTVLARPMRRRDYLIGKYLGLLLMSAANCAIMALSFVGIHALVLGSFDPEILVAVAMSFLQASVVTAIALLITTVSTPLLAFCMTIFLFFAGHLLSDLRMFGERFCGPVGRFFTTAASYALPNLENFDIKGEIVYAGGVGTEFVLMATIYAVAYVSLIIVLSGYLFEKREFK